MKLSYAQRYQVDKLQGKTLMPPDHFDREHNCWVQMPYGRDWRVFEALERKGVVEYVNIENGFTQNGFRLTELGKTL